MKLSDAMVLGSMTWEAAVCLEWNVCAIGVAANAVGIKPERTVTLLGEKWDINDRELSIPKEWPWLSDKCGCGGHVEDERFGSYLWCVSDKFEYEEWPIPELVKYIRSIEPSCGACNRFECTCHPDEILESHLVETGSVK